MVAQTRKSGGGNSPKKLKFREKLVGKGLTTDALHKKLKVLHKELAELDQEDVELSSIDTVCRELVSASILLHKDKGVKAYAACCLADLLRLYAPDAPFTPAELRDIFQFFFRQLEVGLKGSDSPYYNEYFHLLESLSTVKSVVLICDLPQAEELMTQIFNSFFKLVKQDLAKNIELFMADILTALIDECQVPPQDVLETIMAQFMDKNARMDQPAYRLAVQVCNATSDRLQRHICQYFTDIIVQHSQDGDFDEVENAHELIKRLNHSCPSLLHNVFPQLEEELKVEEVQLREIATRVLGEMFADRKGGDLEKKYPSTWALWILRRNDKSSAVRLAFVEGCRSLLQQTSVDPAVREELEESLQGKLLDPDDKVRAAVCKLYSLIDYETALHHVSEAQLRLVAERTLDRKHNVRIEAIHSLGKLYSLAYPEIENNDAAAINHFAWIPEQILHNLSHSSEIKMITEQAIAENILPLPTKNDDETAWTERLLNIIRFMDEKAINTLMTISGLKSNRPSIYDHFLLCCTENNGGIIDEEEQAVKKKLSAVIRRISVLSYDPVKFAADLQSFAKLNEQRLYKLMKVCMDVQTDLKGLVKAMSEFNRRLEQASSALVPTMMSILRQASLWIVNQSSVPTLLKFVRKGETTGRKSIVSKAQAASVNSKSLLTTISKNCPELYRAHVSEILKALAEEKNLPLVEVALQALSALCLKDASVLPSDKRTLERLLGYAHSSNPRHAKFATRILANSRNQDETCMDIVQTVVKKLPESEEVALTAKIAALNEVVRFVPETFESKSDIIIAFLLKTLKFVSVPIDENDSMDVDDAVSELDEHSSQPGIARTKVLILKVLRHRCLVHSQSETAIDVATPVIKLLTSLLDENYGRNEEGKEDPKTKALLRLQAACSLLHLSTVEKFDPLIIPNFLELLMIIQDPVFGIRRGFLNKLITLLNARKLHPRYNLILFMTAHDPETEIKDKAKGYVFLSLRRTPSDLRLVNFEMIFIRLLHVIAHHPDFRISLQEIKDMSIYIKFYLETVATSENVSLLYHLAQRAKTVRDGESHTHSENLYATSELAQEMIKRYAQARGWSLNSYPGRLKVPGDIFKFLPNAEAANKILKTVYLPEEIVVSLFEPVPKEKPKAERKVKRKASTKTNSTSAKRRRRKPRSEDDDDDEDDIIDASEDDDEVVPPSEAQSAAEPSEPSEDEEDAEERGSKGERDLGRGARSRAKARARRQAKIKQKSSKPSSE